MDRNSPFILHFHRIFIFLGNIDKFSWVGRAPSIAQDGEGYIILGLILILFVILSMYARVFHIPPGEINQTVKSVYKPEVGKS